jgi:hypothetical protein
MPAKKNLDQLIANSQPGRLEIQRGQGFKLSTSKPDIEVEKPPKSPVVSRESAKVDKQIIKAYKLIAAQEDRNLYEVMEEALRYWLEIHKGKSGKVEK